MKVQKTINNERGKRLFFLILLALQSCYYDVVITEEETGITAKSFSSEVLPVFRSSCVSCHDGTITLPDLRDANAYKSLTQGNYLSVSDPEKSPLITKIRSEHPFQGALTEGEILRLISWMKGGAKEN
jgi:hypothetical protein